MIYRNLLLLMISWLSLYGGVAGLFVLNNSEGLPDPNIFLFIPCILGSFFYVVIMVIQKIKTGLDLIWVNNSIFVIQLIWAVLSCLNLPSEINGYALVTLSIILLAVSASFLKLTIPQVNLTLVTYFFCVIIFHTVLNLVRGYDDYIFCFLMIVFSLFLFSFSVMANVSKSKDSAFSFHRGSALIVADKGWVITAVNQTCLDLFGYASDRKVIGRKIEELTDPYDDVNNLGFDFYLDQDVSHEEITVSMMKQGNIPFVASVKLDIIDSNTNDHAYGLEIIDITRYQEALAVQERLKVQFEEKAIELSGANESINQLNIQLREAAKDLQGKVDIATQEIHENELRAIALKEDAVIAKNESEKLREKAEIHAEELKFLDKQKTAFFQNMSHELRTPLTLILNPLDSVSQAYPDNREIQVATKNARRLLRLVNQLLDFQKLNAGKKQLMLSPMNLSHFLLICGDYFLTACKNNGIQFSMVCDGLPLSQESLQFWTMTEADAMEKIVFNYLSNALKFTPAEGRIDLGIKLVDSHVRIYVSDTGPGITEEGKKE